MVGALRFRHTTKNMVTVHVQTVKANGFSAGSTIVKFCLALLALLPSLGFAALEHSRSFIYFLDCKGKGRLLRAAPDGSGLQVLRSTGMSGPDGIVVDTAAGRIYWTNMGRANFNDGSIQCSDLDGNDLTTIVPVGGTFTPKQLKLDAVHGKLYWSDREGMRVMRCSLDGSNMEPLVETGRGDEVRKNAANWCVGMALDIPAGMVYWSQKGGPKSNRGTIRRAGVNIPNGQTATNRTDIEILFEGLPEPIDLDLDLANRMMYWTDRGDPPRGNTVNRASMDVRGGAPEILVQGLKEGIGLSLDLPRKRMFFTDLGGNVYSANLDGSDKKKLLTDQGLLTGIVFAE